MYGRVEQTPGFSTTALGLSLRHIVDASSSSNNIHFDVPPLNNKNNNQRGTLKLLQFPLHLSPDIQYASVATQAAILDEFTTWALVVAGDGRAGVSVNLQTHRATSSLQGGRGIMEQQQQQQQESYDNINSHNLNNPCYVDLEATVTKIGRNLGFVRGAIYWHPGGGGGAQSEQQQQPKQRRLLSHGSQVKYLPMGFLTDFSLSQRGWPLTKLYYEHFLSDPKPPATITHVLESLQICPETTTTQVAEDEILDNNNQAPPLATFHATPAHASLGGTIHGGCQAVLMERAADVFVQRLLLRLQYRPNQPSSDAATFQLESISVDYLSTPSREVGLRVVETIPSSSQLAVESHHSLTLRVQLFNLQDDRVNSEGLLRYSIRM